MIQPFEANKQEIVGATKKVLLAFIKESKALAPKTKEEFIKEIGSNFYDDRFNVTELIGFAQRIAIVEWLKQNLNSSDLWKDIAINASNHTAIPYSVANKTVKEFKKQMKS